MKTSKRKFDLATASHQEVSKQLKINLLVLVLVIVVLTINMIHLIRAPGVFYGLLTLLMIIMLFFLMKVRRILKARLNTLS